MPRTDQVRRVFLVTAGVGAAGLVLAPAAFARQTATTPDSKPADAKPADSSPADSKPAEVKPKKPDPLSPAIVKEFVGAGHSNLDKTKEMLANQPGLLNATWDWGGGDFEMAIGGAGHMGRPDIAEFLISQGGRMDIFIAAMLGRLDIVKAVLDAYPNLRISKGPHGITLLAHAKGGKDRAQPVVEYLERLG